MNLYLVGYYGYKNIGDEILLLGLLSYIQKTFEPKTIFIKAGNVKRLEEWLDRHKNLLKKLKVDGIITVVSLIPLFPGKTDLLVLGGGEVITDARSFPYNGWNHFVRYFPYFIRGRVSIVGGIGTIKKFGSKLLYKLFFSKAVKIVVREEFSFKVVRPFFHKVMLHRDFALDVLDKIEINLDPDTSDDYCLINLNNHIRNKENKEKVLEICSTQIAQGQKIYYIAGATGKDDSDMGIFYELKKIFPEIQLYDWTNKELKEICGFIAGAKKGYVTRLHLVILCTYYNIPIDTIIYQEKVNRFLSF